MSANYYSSEEILRLLEGFAAGALDWATQVDDETAEMLGKWADQCHAAVVALKSGDKDPAKQCILRELQDSVDTLRRRTDFAGIDALLASHPQKVTLLEVRDAEDAWLSKERENVRAYEHRCPLPHYTGTLLHRFHTLNALCLQQYLISLESL